MVNHLSEKEFATILFANVSPTSPIQSEEHLFGRAAQLEVVQQALYAPGRSIFIYGDRGVGKTSLAQTAAFSHQSATHDPIFLVCEPTTTFAGLMNSGLAAMRNDKPKPSSSTSLNAKVGFKFITVEAGGKRESGQSDKRDPLIDLNDFITALLTIGEEHSGQSIVIVIDEFDRIKDEQERTRFADFIKQIGDQVLPFHFIFCGVADSVQKLLGAHASCYRYLEQINLSNLSYDARYEIIDNVAIALGCQIKDPFRHRIASISDGFPHYIHRLCEHIFWQMFRDPRVVSCPTADHYRGAVHRSVLGIEQHLKHTYDQATMRDGPGYEQVLWAIADHSDLIRNTESIYQSYLDVVAKYEESDEVLDRPTVVQRLSSLKSQASAKILASDRRGYYHFRENIIRGYVRLRAEEKGCELAIDFAAATGSNRDLQWKPRSPRRGRFGTRPDDRRKAEYPDE